MMSLSYKDCVKNRHHHQYNEEEGDGEEEYGDRDGQDAHADPIEVDR